MRRTEELKSQFSSFVYFDKFIDCGTQYMLAIDGHPLTRILENNLFWHSACFMFFYYKMQALHFVKV